MQAIGKLWRGEPIYGQKVLKPPPSSLCASEKEEIILLSREIINNVLDIFEPELRKTKGLFSTLSTSYVGAFTSK